MDVGNSVRKTLDDWEVGEPEAAMMHACGAVEGTAAKCFPSQGSRARFIRLLRESYGILGPMGAPGVDLQATRFPVRIKNNKPVKGSSDLAELIYGIHRCRHAHGEALPEGFELLPDASGPSRGTRIIIERGKVRLSDRVIFGLLAVAVMSPASVGQRVPEGYHLRFEADQKLLINEWWGRAADFPAVAATDSMPSVNLDFGEWATK